MKNLIEKVCSWIQSHIPTDKLLHFMAGFTVFFIVSLTAFAISNIKCFSILLGSLATLGVAICKEYLDLECGNKFDFLDLLATVVGGAICSLIFLVL